MAKTNFPQPPQRYRAEFVRSDGHWTRQFHDGDKFRIETFNTSGGCQVNIRRLDLGVGWGFGMSSRLVIEVPFTRDDLARVPRLEDQFDWELGKLEAFEGVPVIEYIARSFEEATIVETLLFHRENGVHLRTITFDKLGKQVLEIRTRNVGFDEIDQNLFELPEGYTVKRLGFKRAKRHG